MNPNDEKIEFRKIRDFSQTLNDSFTFIKQNFKPLMLPLLYICGFFILATIATNVLYQIKTVKILGWAKASTVSSVSEITTATYGVEYFLLLFFSIFSVAAVLLVTYCYIKLYKEQQNTPPDVQQVWQLFKQHILEFFIANILLGLFMGIGMVFCLLPGVYLFPLVSLALPVMIMERLGISRAFSKSSSLIKDKWWVTFGLLLVTMLIAYMSMGILGLPSALLTFGAVFLQDSPVLTLVGSIIASILTGLSQFFYVLPAIVTALWYFSLSEEKDSTGLFERIENFGSDESGISNEWPKEDY